MTRILFFESNIILKSNLLHALENTENLNTLNKMKNAVFHDQPNQIIELFFFYAFPNSPEFPRLSNCCYLLVRP
jgi:hypothetical protein